MNQANGALNRSRKPVTSATRPWGRLLVGTFMGYIAALCSASAFVSLLPLHRSEAVYLALILASLGWACLFIYVFAIPSWLRGFRDLTLVAILGAVVWALNKLVFAA